MKAVPGGSFTLSKRPRAFPSGVWGEALYGDGPYLYCKTEAGEQRRYLDWMCALGALTVGHTHPRVRFNVEYQLKRGAIFSLPSWLEEEVAGHLVDVIPCAEQVKVVKTGSEACAAAVRIARAATGKDIILTTDTSYHGWHDWHAVTKPKHPGVPDKLDFYVRTFKYNDLGSYAKAEEEAMDAGGVAAIILEPVQGEPPNDNFLQQLRINAHDLDALLIFDEMLCGGRLRVGGAQELYGVTPDLATFGKAFGAGLPFAFVAGKRATMEHAWPVSGTFSGDALGLAACDAMLAIYRDEPVIDRLWRNGAIAKESLMQVAERYDLALAFYGHDPRFWFDFPPSVDKRLAKSCFVQQAARRGQLVHPNVIFASAAMTTEVATTGAAQLADALDAVCACIKSGGDDDLRHLLTGDMYEDSAR